MFVSTLRAVAVGIAATFALGLSACSDAASLDVSTAQSESPLNANDQAAYNFFVGKGLTNFQAAGIVGNLDQESNVNPLAVQQGGPGRGIAQWSAGGRWDTDNNDNAVAYANQQKLSVWSLQLQLEFTWYELQTFSGYGLAALKKSANVTDATIAFQTDFEGCGNCQQSTRIAYAQAVLNAYGAIEYGAQYVAQSFPLASTTLTMQEGEVLPSFIELKNSGAKPWDSNTHLATTQPRDRASAFADSTWVAANRPAKVNGTVAPGASYKFAFDLVAPNKPGTYDEFFGVVQEGVTWFSAPGQGGPADDVLEVKILVIPKEAGPIVDAGKDVSVGDAAAKHDASPEGDAGEVAPAVDPNAGCGVGPSRVDGSSWLSSLALLGAFVGVARRRTRARRRDRSLATRRSKT